MNNLPAYLTFTVALIVAWIGFQQYILAREKFKLDLFEKRFAVYRATQAFLSRIVQNPRIDWNESIELLRGTQDAVFLFGPEIVNYIDSLYKKSLDMKGLQLKYEPLPVGPERSTLCDSETKLVRELIDELPKLKDVFGPYLRFKVWR